MKFCVNEDLLSLGLACLKFLWSGVSGLSLVVSEARASSLWLGLGASLGLIATRYIDKNEFHPH